MISALKKLMKRAALCAAFIVLPIVIQPALAADFYRTFVATGDVAGGIGSVPCTSLGDKDGVGGVYIEDDVQYWWYDHTDTTAADATHLRCKNYVDGGVWTLSTIEYMATTITVATGSTAAEHPLLTMDGTGTTGEVSPEASTEFTANHSTGVFTATGGFASDPVPLPAYRFLDSNGATDEELVCYVQGNLSPNTTDHTYGDLIFYCAIDADDADNMIEILRFDASAGAWEFSKPAVSNDAVVSANLTSADYDVPLDMLGGSKVFAYNPASNHKVNLPECTSDWDDYSRTVEICQFYPSQTIEVVPYSGGRFRTRDGTTNTIDDELHSPGEAFSMMCVVLACAGSVNSWYVLEEKGLQTDTDSGAGSTTVSAEWTSEAAN